MEIEGKISMKSMAGFSAFDENFGFLVKKERMKLITLSCC